MIALDLPVVDAGALATAQEELGSALPRILSYFRQDGVASLTAVEDAMAQHDPAVMVRPAHTLKGEARQFGAARLAEMALHLEMTARRCVEAQVALPDDLARDVAALRPCFHETVGELERRVTPPAPPPLALAPRRAFGRRTG